MESIISVIDLFPWNFNRMLRVFTTKRCDHNLYLPNLKYFSIYCMKAHYVHNNYIGLLEKTIFIFEHNPEQKL